MTSATTIRRIIALIFSMLHSQPLHLLSNIAIEERIILSIGTRSRFASRISHNQIGERTFRKVFTHWSSRLQVGNSLFLFTCRGFLCIRNSGEFFRFFFSWKQSQFVYVWRAVVWKCARKLERGTWLREAAPRRSR